MQSYWSILKLFFTFCRLVSRRLETPKNGKKGIQWSDILAIKYKKRISIASCAALCLCTAHNFPLAYEKFKSSKMYIPNFIILIWVEHQFRRRTNFECIFFKRWIWFEIPFLLLTTYFSSPPPPPQPSLHCTMKK